MYLFYFRLEFGVPLKHTLKNNEIPALFLVCILIILLLFAIQCLY